MAGRPRVSPLDSAILVALAGWITALYAPLWSGDPRGQAAFRPGDMTEQHYPFAAYAHRRLQAGQIPLWNPFGLGGHPFLADPQTPALYPVQALVVGMAGGSSLSLRGYAAEVVAHLVVTAWGAYLFFRWLARERGAAAFGAFAWGLSGYLTAYPLQNPPILFTMAWLPWLLWGLGHLLTDPRPRRRWEGLAIGMAALTLLGSHAQAAFYSGLMAVGFGAAAAGRRWSRWAALLRVGLFGLGLAAARLLPVLEILPWTERTSWTFPQRAGGFETWELWGILWPHLTLWSPLYVGVPTLILAAHCRSSPGQRRERSPALWLGLLALGVFLSRGGEAALYPVAAWWLSPLLGFFRNQERAAVIAAWSLITLAVLGWPRIPDRPTVRAMAVGLGGWGLVLGGGLLLVQGQDPSAWPRLHRLLSQAMEPLLIGGLALLVLSGRPHWRWALVALVALDVGSVAWRTATAGHWVWEDPEALHTPPLAPDRIPAHWPPLRLDTRGLLPGNWTTRMGIEDLHGFTTLPLRPVERFRREVPGERVWALMGVGCFIQRADEPPLPFPSRLQEALTTVHGVLEFRCLEQPFSRFHLVYEAVAFDDETALRAMRDSRFDPLRVVILDRVVPLPGMAPPETPPRVVLRSWAPEEIRLEVVTGRPGFLVVGDMWAPGWEAAVDGQPAPVLRAYTALRAIPVPAGAHAVVLRYRPLSFRLGVLLSGLALLLVAIRIAGPPLHLVRRAGPIHPVTAAMSRPSGPAAPHTQAGHSDPA